MAAQICGTSSRRPKNTIPDKKVAESRSRSDAIKFQEAIGNRLAKFSLQIEPSKTRLVEFGRLHQSMQRKRARKWRQSISLALRTFAREKKRQFYE